jgi:hypothetical protein
MKSFFLPLFLTTGLFMIAITVMAAPADVPEPFRGYTAGSESYIKYDDLNELLKSLVVDTGWSSREVAAPVEAPTGTRMKPKVQSKTVNEGNRFFFEAFEDDKEAQQALVQLRDNLALVPSQVPLDRFSRDEQLAYWLNLYNVTMLNEVVKVYPKRSLKKLLVGKKSVKKQKLLTVAGVSLSLDDIQYTILGNNYNNDPLILYGLYQGIIGGPNIRKSAYTGSNVHKNLERNAREFINSNRGTYPGSGSTFKVSSLYDRNKVYFPDFQKDLRTHLMQYIDEPERADLQASSKIKAGINDWTVTDLYGSFPEIGGSFATNRAALLNSIQSTTRQADTGAIVTMANSAASSDLALKAPVNTRFSPDLTEFLLEIKDRQEKSNLAKDTTVTVEELGEVPVDQEATADESEEGGG